MELLIEQDDSLDAIDLVLAEDAQGACATP
jgi:hypothetical protein